MSYSPVPSARRERSPIVDVVISAVIGFFVLVPFDLVGAILNTTSFGKGYGDSVRWVFWGIYSIPVVLLVIALLAWGRSPGRRVGGAVAALVLLGLQRCLVAPPIVQQLLASWDLSHTILNWTSNFLWIFGWILAWSIARRRTGLSWIGLIPALAITGAAVWLNVEVVANPFDEIWQNIILGAAITDLAILAGILVIWASDGLGLALLASTNGTPKPYAPQPYSQPFSQPYPPQPPNPYPPTRDYPAQHPPRY